VDADALLELIRSGIKLIEAEPAPERIKKVDFTMNGRR